MTDPRVSLLRKSLSRSERRAQRDAERLAFESQDNDISAQIEKVAAGLSGLSSHVTRGAKVIIRADEKHKPPSNEP